MNNMTLNAGGVVGGLVGLGGACLFLYWKGDTEVRIGKLIVACVVGGAVAGNYLWGLAFPPRPARTYDTPPTPEAPRGPTVAG